MPFPFLRDSERVLSRKMAMEPINKSYIDHGDVDLNENPFVNCLVDFHHQIREKIQFNDTPCQNCDARDIGIKLMGSYCSSCTKLKDLVSSANDMWLGDQPEELKGLRVTEVAAISRVLPVAQIYRVGNSTRMKGHCVTYNQDPSEIVNKLPRHPSNLAIVFIKSPGKHVKTLTIRRDKVLTAILYLKNNNRYYSDIDIDYETLNNCYSNDKITVPTCILPTASVDDVDADGPGDNDDEHLANDYIIAATTKLHIATVGKTQTEFIVRDLVQQLQSTSEPGATEANPMDWAVRGECASEYSEGFWSHCFPHLFCHGNGGYQLFNSKYLSISNWLSHLMHHQSGRFARDKRFCFFAFNFLQKNTAFSAGNLYAKTHNLQSKEDLLQLIGDNPVTGLDAVVKDIHRQTRKVKGSNAYMKSMSNKAIALVNFYRYHSNDRDNFNIFFTLSSADLHWPQFFEKFPEGRAHLDKIFKEKEDDIPLADDRSKYVTAQEDFMFRRNFLEEHAHEFDLFFDAQLNLLLECVLYPMLGITDHIIRYEYQQRGAVHAHILFAVPMGFSEQVKSDIVKAESHDVDFKREAELFSIDPVAGVVDIGDPSNMTPAEIAINNKMRLIRETCLRIGICERHPSDDQNNWYLADGGTLQTAPPSSVLRKTLPESLQDPKVQLIDVVNKVLTHKCSPRYCCKPHKADPNDTSCRFSFPKSLLGFSKCDSGTRRTVPPHACAAVTGYADRNQRIRLHSVRNHPRVGSYIPWLALGLPCNHDIQFIDNVMVLQNYLSKYITKAETSSSVVDTLHAEIWQQIEGNVAPRKICQSIIRKATVEHDYSLAEVHLYLNKKDAMLFSRKFVYLNACDTSRLVNYTRDDDGLSYDENLADLFDRRYSDVNFCAMLEEYEDALVSGCDPLPPNPECYTMYDYASMFTKKWTPLERFVVVVYFPSFKSRPNMLTKPDMFRRFAITLLRLFSINPQSLSSLDTKTNQELEALGDSAFRHGDAKHWLRELWEGTSQPDLAEHDRIPLFAPDEEKQEDDELGFLNNDEFEPFNDDLDEMLFDVDFTECGEFDKQADREKFCPAWTRETGNEFRQSLQMDDSSTLQEPALPFEVLNQRQQQAVTYLNQVTRKIIDQPDTADQFFLEICGAAGSGKTEILKRYKVDTHEYLVANSTVAIGSFLCFSAPTGCATKLLPHPHSTLHKLLRLPIKLPTKEVMEDLPVGQLRVLEDNLKHLKVLVIDEKSFVGCKFFLLIEQRLRQIKGRQDLAFGGVSIVIVGDFKQLAPVLDAALYVSKLKIHPLQSEGQHLYTSLFSKCIFLTENQRQANDPAMQQVLSDFTSGKFSEASYKILAKRALNGHELSDEEKNFFNTNAIKLCAIKQNFAQYNAQKIKALNKPVTVVDSINTPPDGARFTDSDAGGLPQTVVLAVGMKVMLTANIDISCSLSNGSQGIIIAIIYPRNETKNDLPEVLIQFDQYTGQRSFLADIPRVYPIGAIERTWTFRKKLYTRKMLPIVAGYSFSIHKSQGQTLPCAIVDLGDKDFAPGLTYTALTRVRRLADLVFDPMPPMSRFTKVVTSKSVKRQLEDDNLKKIRHDDLVNILNGDNTV